MDSCRFNFSIVASIKRYFPDRRFYTLSVVPVIYASLIFIPSYICCRIASRFADPNWNRYRSFSFFLINSCISSPSSSSRAGETNDNVSSVDRCEKVVSYFIQIDPPWTWRSIKSCSVSGRAWKSICCSLTNSPVWVRVNRVIVHMCAYWPAYLYASGLDELFFQVFRIIAFISLNVRILYIFSTFPFVASRLFSLSGKSSPEFFIKILQHLFLISRSMKC